MRSTLERTVVRPVEGPTDAVVACALKSLRRERFGIDDLLVLPRAMAEVRGSAIIASPRAATEAASRP